MNNLDITTLTETLHKIIVRYNATHYFSHVYMRMNISIKFDGYESRTNIVFTNQENYKHALIVLFVLHRTLLAYKSMVAVGLESEQNKLMCYFC